MCNRYAHRHTPSEIVAFFAVALHPGVAEHLLRPNYNVAPRDKVPAVRKGPRRRELVGLHWGFELRGKIQMNGRSETAAVKPAFKDSLKARRCLLPASGFFEWNHDNDGPPQPYYFYARDHAPLALGAIWQDDKVCILTCGPNAVLAPIHDRMPVLIQPADFDQWLNAANDPQPLMKPAPDDLLTVHAVSKKINRVGVQGRELLEPVTLEPRRQMELL